MKNVTLQINGGYYEMTKEQLKMLFQAADLKLMEMFRAYDKVDDTDAMHVVNDVMIMTEDIIIDMETGD